MEPLKVLTNNFVDPSSNHHRLAWYAWSGAALALVAVAEGLYWFGSLVQPQPAPLVTYFNPSLKVILSYPADWLPVSAPLDTDGLPRRFAGGTGWFEISGTSGDGVILTEVATSLNQLTKPPFGQNPKITTVQIAGQPGVIIMPTETQVRAAAAVVAYPKPVELGLTNYRFLILKAEVGHLVNLVESLRLVDNASGEVEGLPNIVVYAPPPRALISSPFSLSGIARVFESNVSLKVVNTNNQTIWTGYVTANAPDMGAYGGFTATVDLSGTEVAAGERVRLEGYQSSAKDGSEIDKVIVPLQVEVIQPTKVVEAYFGQVGKSEDDCVSVFPVERHVPETKTLGRVALEQLVQGPTLRERQEGYFTSLPPGVEIERLAIADGVAQAEFTETLEWGVGGSCRVLAIRSQIEKTLKQFPSVKEVIISIDGRTEDILQP